MKALLHKNLFLLLMLFMFLLSIPGISLGQEANSVLKGDIQRSSADKALGVQLPFITNEGQVKDKRVKFYSNTFGGMFFVTQDGEMVYSFVQIDKESLEERLESRLNSKPGEKKKKRKAPKRLSLKETLVGSLKTIPEAMDPVKTNINYFLGSDKSKWKKGAVGYNNISLGQVYEGINLELSVTGKKVEKVFIVSPGADLDMIKLKIDGANSLEINNKGELVVNTALGVVNFSAPVAYQDNEGKKEYVQVSYDLEGDTYGFKLGDYDRSRPLVIDPVLNAMIFGGTDYEEANAVALDNPGNVFIQGVTLSPDFPTTYGVINPSYNGDYDVFIAKIDHDLNELLACTILGGEGEDYSESALALDSAGNVFVAGYTCSDDFPLGLYNPSLSG